MFTGHKLAIVCTTLLASFAAFGVPAFASSGASTGSASALVSEPNPYAARVVQTSNSGLEEKVVHIRHAGSQALRLAFMQKGIEIPEIPDISTTGLLCQLLTLQPAQGCLETQLSGCTTQWFCTSNTWDKCTTGDWCTIAAQCTNTKGCTDAGACTQANGCTGTTHCTAGSGCTQHDSCTNGSNCTEDAGLCTGGAACTKGTGCTNGNNCTTGSGCTKDAQCTKGSACTKSGGSAQCTSGSGCTTGASCPKKTVAAVPGDNVDVATALYSGATLDGYLSGVGAPSAADEPHFAPEAGNFSFAWAALLFVPGLAVLRKRNRE